VTIIVVALSISSLSLLSNRPSDAPSIPVKITYSTHARIIINGDAGFLGPNASTGISRGSGTPSDPYVIEGWEINASGAGTAIVLADTDKFFRIENCYLHHAIAFGIYLFNVTNGTLVNNDCMKNDDGICLFDSNWNSISWNNCSDNSQNGINLGFFCYNNTLTGNSLFYNSNAGMQVVWSDDNTISQNDFSNNTMNGLFMNTSNRNTISDNICSYNAWIGMILGSSNGNVIFRNEFSHNFLYGLSFWDSKSNGSRVFNNTFYCNRGSGETYDASHIQAFDAGHNYWNTSGTPHGFGNYWYDWYMPDFDFDGIVDNPYNIAGPSGTKDYYPRTTPTPPIPEFSDLIVPIVGLILIALIVGRTRKKPCLLAKE
jgi:parallel beta-helix repeat protein